MKDHVDYTKRVVPLRRWHPGRLVGESTGQTGDARADESLYKPSELGSASASVREVTAGENRPFELAYRVGARALPAGATVRFWMAGQGSLGDAPQAADSARPGYVEIVPVSGVELEPLCDRVRVLSLADGEDPKRPLRADDRLVGPVTIGFRVVRGGVPPGAEVRIRVGGAAGFRWKRLTGRKEFKVIVELGDGGPRMRLPEPVRIDIRPLAPARIEVLLPGTAAAGGAARAAVSVRDAHDNRVPVTMPVELEWGGRRTTVHLAGGAGSVDLPAPDAPGRAVARAPGLPEAASNWCLPADGPGRREEAEPGRSGQSPTLQGPGDGASLSALEGRPPCRPSASSPLLNLFFGDMHAHDSNSTAEGYTADCYAWARDEKRLDFLSLPVQVHRWLDNEKWALVKHMNEYFLDEGRFVTFLAFEWQHSSCGDKVIHYLGGDMPYLPVDDPRYADPARLYAALRGADAFIISHHPGYELGLHVPGTRWEAVETDVDRLLELWSMHGSSEGYDPADRPLIPPRRPGGAYEALRKGLHMGFVAGSDSHTGRPGGSTDDARPYRGGLCGVWAEELTRRSLFAAFKARRTYALTGARIALRFTVNGAPMGSEVAAAPAVDIRVDAWAEGPIAKVEILRDARLLREFGGNGPECHVEHRDALAGPAFYHCRVTQRDGQLAVCSPVWVG